MTIDHEMGENFKAAADSSINPNIQLLYKTYNSLIAEEIKNQLKDKSFLEILDIGGGPGLFSKDICSLLDKRGIATKVTNIDKSDDLLNQDVSSQEKIKIDILDATPEILGRQFDVILMRYVLQYNL